MWNKKQYLLIALLEGLIYHFSNWAQYVVFDITNNFDTFMISWEKGSWPKTQRQQSGFRFFFFRYGTIQMIWSLFEWSASAKQEWVCKRKHNWYSTSPGTSITSLSYQLFIWLEFPFCLMEKYLALELNVLLWT